MQPITSQGDIPSVFQLVKHRELNVFALQHSLQVAWGSTEIAHDHWFQLPCSVTQAVIARTVRQVFRHAGHFAILQHAGPEKEDYSGVIKPTVSHSVSRQDRGRRDNGGTREAHAMSSTSSLNLRRLLASIFWSLSTLMATRRPRQRPS